MRYLVELAKDEEEIATRDGFGEAILEIGSNSRIVVLTADVAESVRVSDFAKKYPDRFINVGVAEQNLVGVAAGLALSGKKPIAIAYATFSPGRSWDQIRVSIAYSQAPVLLVGSHAGLTVGPDGATHQALEDIAILRSLPNLTIAVPADANQAKTLAKLLADYDKPAYLRLSREKSPILFSEDEKIVIGKIQVLTVGDDVTVFACGEMVAPALEAARDLESEISVQVVNVHTIKPLDQEGILDCISHTRAAVTVENHQLVGGLGSAIAELSAKKLPIPIEFVGVNDSFGTTGTAKELMSLYGLTKEDIIQKIVKVVERKNAH